VSRGIGSARLVAPCVAALALLAASAGARAEPPPRRHAVYLEVLGKGGLWGAGYDVHLSRRFACGATLSFYVLDHERVTSLSPYLAAILAGGARHRWFAHAGPAFVHVATPSPVPEWPGTSRSGLGAELSSGYEYRDRLLVRVFGMATVGRGGAAPWLGASLGWTL
jgi:hypothetical protein